MTDDEWEPTLRPRCGPDWRIYMRGAIERRMADGIGTQVAVFYETMLELVRIADERDALRDAVNGVVGLADHAEGTCLALSGPERDAPLDDDERCTCGLRELVLAARAAGVNW